MANNHLEVLKQSYANFAKGDIPAVMSVFDPNIRWTEADGFPYAGTYVGPAAVSENVFMKLGTEWDGWKVDPHEFIDGDEKIVVLGKYSGTCKATGKSFIADFAHVWKLRDGKATEFKQYVDSALVQEAIRS